MNILPFRPKTFNSSFREPRLSELRSVTSYTSLESISTGWKLKSTRPLSESNRDDEQGFDEIWPPAYKLDRDKSELIRGGPKLVLGPAELT